MKRLILLFFLLTSSLPVLAFDTNSVKFINAFPKTKIPKLHTNIFKSDSNILSLSPKSKDGIILYNNDNKEWQKFEYLKNYESYGKILKIKKINEILLIVLESATLIKIRNHEFKMFNNSFHYIFVRHNIIYLFPSQTGRSWFRNNKNYFITYNIKTNIQSKIFFDLKNHNGEILTVEFYDNYFWLSTFMPAICCGEGSRHNLKIDLEGNVSKVSSIKDFPKSILLYKKYKNLLYIFSRNAIYIYKNNTVKKAKSFKKDLKYIKYKSAYQFNNTLSLLPETYDRNSTATLINLDNLVITDIPIKTIYGTDNYDYDDIVIKQDTVYILSSVNKYVIRFNYKKKGLLKYFPTEQGLIKGINYFCEDQSEIWLTSSKHGIFRYNKTTSNWKVYPQFIDMEKYFLDDRPESNPLGIETHPNPITIRPRQISLNRNYVFITRDNQYGQPVEFILFNRKTEKFNIITKKALFDKFLYNFPILNYTSGKKTMEQARKEETFKIIYQDANPWAVLLYFLKLPLTGVDFEYKNRIIQGKNISLLSSSVHYNSYNWYRVIYTFNHNSKSLLAHILPKRIEHFETSIIPFYIVGNEKNIYGISHGWGNRGAFKYNLENKKIYTYKNWYDNLKDCWSIFDSNDKIFVGINGNNKYLGVIDKKNNNLIVFGSDVGFSHCPHTFYANNKYALFESYKDLIGFDLKNDSWFHFKSENYNRLKRIYKSKFGVYIDTEQGYKKLLNK